MLPEQRAEAVHRLASGEAKTRRQGVVQLAESGVQLALRAWTRSGDYGGVQSDLLRFDVEGANAYWQQLHGAALAMQAELLACGAQGTVTEATQKAVTALGALPAMAAAFGNGGFQGNARSEAS